MAAPFIVGDTIRLQVEFKTFVNEFGDPTGLTLKIYSVDKIQVGATITSGEMTKTDVGKYQYDYTIPDGYSQLAVEWAGVLESKPVVGRTLLDIRWV